MSSSPEGEYGPGGAGWSFGSHNGEVDSAGKSIWPGPGQASIGISNGDSAGTGWARATRRDQDRMPRESGGSPAVSTPAYHQVLDGTLSADWFSANARRQRTAQRTAEGAATCPRLVTPATPQGWLHDEELPLPDLRTILEIERECRSLPDHQMGPLGQRWLDEVYAWSERMREKYQGNRVQVAGSWRLNIDAWRVRLARLPAARRNRVLKIIEFGATLPFKDDKPPAKPIRIMQNHPKLHEQSEEVWKTLSEQLLESAVMPHDCGGAIPEGAAAGSLPQGADDVELLPKGVFPIRWVEKSDSDRVRICVNMRALNKNLKDDCGKVDLATLSKMASLWQQNDEQVTLDQHAAYYHLEYNKDCTQWVGFMIDDSELPPHAVEELSRLCPQARWGKSKWVFTYKGLAMGCSPSAAQYCLCADALMDTWRGCTVGQAVGLPPEQLRCSQYIDDSIYMVQGFAHSMELALRVVLEHIICGFHINVLKSDLLPSRIRKFLGCFCDSRDLSFSLTPSRCRKLGLRLTRLRQAVEQAKRRGDARVDMRAIAKVIGSIWSIYVCCHKAVALQCRAMCAVLASELRHDWLRRERDSRRLKLLLRSVWRGTALWSREADRELRFWLKVVFAALKSPMSFDIFMEDVKSFVFRPARDVLASNVRVFAADSSARATGAATFVPGLDGQWKPTETMFIELSDEAIKQSSTFAELEGILKADLALVPDSCKFVLPVCDNLATTIIIRKGSKHPLLHLLAVAIFERCLRIGRVLIPVWQPRESRIIRIVDLGSRVVDHCNFAMPMQLFWRANAIASRLWGRGFQFDRFSSFETAMPMDGRRKLPFNSYYVQPYSSGRDAFHQDWRGWVNWAHPPHHLVGRVISLLRRQHAVGAVALPMGARALWSSAAVEGAEGVKHVFRFNPRLACNRMVGKHTPCRWRGNFAVVFFDFRRRHNAFRHAPSAERLRTESAAEPKSPQQKLLFCLAPGFLPGRVPLTRFADCIPLLQASRV